MCICASPYISTCSYLHTYVQICMKSLIYNYVHVCIHFIYVWMYAYGYKYHAPPLVPCLFLCLPEFRFVSPLCVVFFLLSFFLSFYRSACWWAGQVVNLSRTHACPCFLLNRVLSVSCMSLCVVSCVWCVVHVHVRTCMCASRRRQRPQTQTRQSWQSQLRQDTCACNVFLGARCQTSSAHRTVCEALSSARIASRSSVPWSVCPVLFFLGMLSKGRASVW